MYLVFWSLNETFTSMIIIIDSNVSVILFIAFNFFNLNEISLKGDIHFFTLCWANTISINKLFGVRSIIISRFFEYRHFSSFKLSSFTGGFTFLFKKFFNFRLLVLLCTLYINLFYI